MRMCMCAHVYVCVCVCVCVCVWAVAPRSGRVWRAVASLVRDPVRSPTTTHTRTHAHTNVEYKLTRNTRKQALEVGDGRREVATSRAHGSDFEGGRCAHQ